ncbi:MAG: hypothetical protein KBE65_21245 [Phycisphaerae bacterium]|nr:hypothetical protein [Phycisphaerae bacterium]
MKLTDAQLDTLRKAFRLSPRETQIVDLLFEGVATNPEVGARLQTTEDTVKAGVRTLYLKTQTRSKHELVLKLIWRLMDDIKAQQMAALRRQRERPEYTPGWACPPHDRRNKHALKKSGGIH